MHELQEDLQAFAYAFDAHFGRLLSSGDAPPELLEAVRYSALASGKRIRPWLVVRCCELVGGSREIAWPPAAAVECIHAFSLIHDDLPALDNDDMRRGRPTAHKQFGEAMAILAGDVLMALAFELVSAHVLDPKSRLITLELARATGWTGMIGGQVLDIDGNQHAPSIERAQQIHDRKTARLFAASCRIGGMAAGAEQSVCEMLGQFGTHLGRAFQIADDLLDVSMGADLAPGGKISQGAKQSFPACVGVEASRVAMDTEVAEAINGLKGFGCEADDLRAMARFAASRNY